jgi:hypothetical protein
LAVTEAGGLTGDVVEDAAADTFHRAVAVDLVVVNGEERGVPRSGG